MTPYCDQRVDERVTAQPAALTAAHPVHERRPDERDAADHHERVGTAPPRVVGHGAVVVGAAKVVAVTLPDPLCAGPATSRSTVSGGKQRFVALGAVPVGQIRPSVTSPHFNVSFVTAHDCNGPPPFDDPDPTGAGIATPEELHDIEPPRKPPDDVQVPPLSTAWSRRLFGAWDKSQRVSVVPALGTPNAANTSR